MTETATTPNDGRKVIEQFNGVMLTATHLNKKMFFVEYRGPNTRHDLQKADEKQMGFAVYWNAAGSI